MNNPVDNIKNSFAVVILVAQHYFEEPACMAQLGAAVSMNKPIFLIIEKGTKVPKKLLKVTDGFAFYSKGNLDEVANAYKRTQRKIEKLLGEHVKHININ